MRKVKLATTEKEINEIIELRYKVLRQPWQQSKETATDNLEHSSLNAYINDESGRIVACGRLQKNTTETGQIRFMAVDNLHQSKGLGKIIVSFLEEEGKKTGLKKIELQARENAVDFYKKVGYSIKEKTFLLWGIIQHFLMEKEF